MWRWGGSAAVFEAPAIVAGLDDVTVVSDAVEQRSGHLGIAEYGGPFAERQVGGDDHRGLLVELAHQVEQQLAARTGKRQIAQLIEHDEFKAAEVGGECTGL